MTDRVLALVDPRALPVAPTVELRDLDGDPLRDVAILPDRSRMIVPKGGEVMSGTLPPVVGPPQRACAPLAGAAS